jgi:hypothetical protein
LFAVLCCIGRVSLGLLSLNSFRKMVLLVDLVYPEKEQKHTYPEADPNIYENHEKLLAWSGDSYKTFPDDPRSTQEVSEAERRNGVT